MMEMTGTDLDGMSIGMITLERVGAQQLALNGQRVVATRVIGSRVALIAGGTQVCVLATDYWRVLGTATDAPPDAAGE
jgi:hypothetical protein